MSSDHLDGGAPMRDLHIEFDKSAEGVDNWWNFTTGVRWAPFDHFDPPTDQDPHPLEQFADFEFYDACLWGDLAKRITIEHITIGLHAETGYVHVEAVRRVIDDFTIGNYLGASRDTELRRHGYRPALAWQKITPGTRADGLRAWAPLDRLLLPAAAEHVDPHQTRRARATGYFRDEADRITS